MARASTLVGIALSTHMAGAWVGAAQQSGEYGAIRWLGAHSAEAEELVSVVRYGAIIAVPLLVLLAGTLLWSRSLRTQVVRRTRELQKETEASGKMAEALRRSLRNVELLAATAGELLQADEPQKVVEGLCRQVMERLDCDVFVNFLMDEDGQGLGLNACAGVPPQMVDQIGRLDLGVAICGCVARDGRRIVAEQIQGSDDERADLVRGMGVMAYACHPLLGPGGEVLGTLSFGTRKRAQFDDWELALMKAVADHVAVAIARMRAEATIRQSKAAAEQASRAKDQFIAVLSHELRTPLTPALAALSIMRDDQRLPEDVLEDVEMVNRNIALEVRLIDDLLDVSRIISGKLHMEKRAIDVAVVMREAARTVAMDLDAKGQMLKIETPGAPYMAMADSARLQQVFWNLLRNAVKFSPAGGEVLFRARVASASRNPPSGGQQSIEGEECPRVPGDERAENHLLVEVIDRGAGLDAEMFPRLFNAFEQEKSARSFGGLGLGLSICKAVVEMHGGAISARSDGVGRGATFTVELPMVKCPQAPAGSNPPTSATAAGNVLPESGTPLAILLVEDHADTAKLMRRMLISLGHVVSTAGSVAEALRAVEELEPDVLISDLGLPDGSGLDLIVRLRAQGRHIPGIVLSGFGTAADVEKSIAAGFSEHLVKPLQGIEALAAALTRLRSTNMPA